VTQSCRPVTSLLTVTRTRGHWIAELDGRPALDVYREVARGPLAADLRRAAAILLVALPQDGDESLREGRYVVRNVAGFAEGSRAFAVAQSVRCGDRIALALRDAEGARQDLKRMLHTLEGAPSCGGLYFSCCARGRDFFGVPGLEAAYLQQALDPAPVGGMFGSCEIGPLGATTQLLTYTGVLALLGA
jgi:small ligand-binding sensory domain FIST